MTVTRCGQATHRFALNPTAAGARLDDSRSGLPREDPGRSRESRGSPRHYRTATGKAGAISPGLNRGRSLRRRFETVRSGFMATRTALSPPCFQ